MRILHTSDLHLGRSLYGARRDDSFHKLLHWLCELIAEKNIDCLVIAGDVFDNATPSHFAQNLYYDFLTAVRGKTNCRHIVITSGNHDSPSFLNAPQRLLSAIGVTVVGEALSDPAGEALLLRDASGEPEAVVAAVPFLREADIRKSIEHETDEQKDHQVIEGTRRHYREAVDGALALRKNCGRDDIPLIATGHLFAAHCDCGTEERSLYIGSLGQIPADVFPEEIDYLALGHLHRAQCLAGNAARRYAGSPLALDFGEGKQKSVVIAELTSAGEAPAIELVPVPTFDRLEQVTGSLDEILTRLQALADENTPMFCEVIHDEGAYAPHLAQVCRNALGQSPVALVRIMSRAVVENRISAEDRISDVHTLTPEAMFELKLERTPDLTDEDREGLRRAYAQVLFEIRNDDAEETTENAAESTPEKTVESAVGNNAESAAPGA